MDQQGRYLLIVKDDLTVEQRRVVVGSRSGNRTVISEGLEPNDRVVVRGVQKRVPAPKFNFPNPRHHSRHAVMISNFFIDRPVAANVIAWITIILGVVALRSLPVERYPNITPPTVQVTAVYPGANAQVVADTVAAPIEQQVNGVENMVYMSSSSSATGSYSLTITFGVGTISTKHKCWYKTELPWPNLSYLPKFVSKGSPLKAIDQHLAGCLTNVAH